MLAFNCSRIVKNTDRTGGNIATTAYTGGCNDEFGDTETFQENQQRGNLCLISSVTDCR